MEERGSRGAFTDLGTLGVEEEFFVVDDAGRPVSGSDELVYDGDPPEILADRLDHELFKTVIETQIPKSDSLASARSNVHDVRDALVEYAAGEGFRVAGAGLHPGAVWRELEHAEKPRYRSQLDRIQYPQHRNTTAGLHVHVGVDDADAATWIANELRWFLPPLLALSANSPFWDGYDTGLASARAKVFEGLPNTGMPTAFDGFDEFQRFERRMIDSGSIRDRGELWFDVRPHSAHGTVEVRVPDGQADPDVVMAFVEYTDAIVRDLYDRYEDLADPWETRGTGLPHQHRREILDENKWRAMRYGHDASFLALDGDGEIDLAAFVDRECERLDVTGLRRVYERESGAERQRRIREAEGFDVLCESLVLDS
jgi:carboxylate-amine ligase